MKKTVLKTFFFKFINNNYLLVFLTFIATAALFYMAYMSRSVFTDRDGLSYVSIAQHYASTDFSVAINAYWSPFVSWLMTPLVAAGVDGLFSFMIINALAATIVLLFGLKLIRRFSKSNFLSILYILCVIPFLMDSIKQTNPDMWVIAWVFIFLFALLKSDEVFRQAKDWQPVLRISLLLGFVGACGYFVKLFLLPFFVVSVAAWLLIASINYGKIKTGIKLLPMILLIFGIFSSPWIIALSQKYNKLTIGSAYEQNVGSKRLKLDKGSAYETSVASLRESSADGLVPLFPQDPTYYSKGRNTSDASLITEVKFYMNERVKAFPFYLNKINSISPFILPVLISLAFAVIFGKVTYKRQDQRALIMLGLLSAIYFVGYAPLVSVRSGGGNARYYWPLFPLALAIAMISLPYFLKIIKKQKLWQQSVFLIIVLLLPFTVFSQYALGKGYAYSLNIRPRLKLEEPKSSKNSLFSMDDDSNPEQGLAEEIFKSGVISPEDKISGNNKGVVYIAFYTKSTAYSGVLFDGNIYSQSSRDILKNLGIDYYINFVPQDKRNLTLDSKLNIAYQTKYPGITCSNGDGSVSGNCVIQIVRL